MTLVVAYVVVVVELAMSKLYLVFVGPMSWVIVVPVSVENTVVVSSDTMVVGEPEVVCVVSCDINSTSVLESVSRTVCVVLVSVEPISTVATYRISPSSTLVLTEVVVTVTVAGQVDRSPNSPVLVIADWLVDDVAFALLPNMGTVVLDDSSFCVVDGVIAADDELPTLTTDADEPLEFDELPIGLAADIDCEMACVGEVDPVVRTLPSMMLEP